MRRRCKNIKGKREGEKKEEGGERQNRKETRTAGDDEREGAPQTVEPESVEPLLAHPILHFTEVRGRSDGQMTA